MEDQSLYDLGENPGGFEQVPEGKRNMVFPIIVLVVSIAGTIFFAFSSNRARVNKAFSKWLQKNEKR
jgi:hypothetical protein